MGYFSANSYKVDGAWGRKLAC